jgi:hypothetical protein
MSEKDTDDKTKKVEYLKSNKKKSGTTRNASATP